ncbi:MAG: signal peptidase II [Caulobacterales bacterium 32-67-6]|nr:MAG: signal peptidase II [Caulobacterales bacterium 32-67-6]
MTRAPFINRHGWTAYGLALAVIVLDQLSKHWILFVYDLPARISEQVAGPFFLTMVWNQGVSFGLLRADQDLGRWLLVAFSVLVAIALAVWARRGDRTLMAWALGLVMGGAIGNAIGRARFGAVVDFIDVSRLYFPWVFNIADAAISVGVVLLLIDGLRRDSTT